jgi:hypothetical protein
MIELEGSCSDRQSSPPSLAATMQRREMMCARRSTIAQHRETIVRRRERIVRRVEMIAQRQQVYVLLRAPHRDAWLDEAVVRFADAIARVGEAAFRLADRARVRGEAHLRNERAATTHRASSHVIRRRVALLKAIAPNARRTRLHESTIVRDASAIVTDDEAIRPPAYRTRPRGEIIRHDGGRKALRVKIDATARSRRLHRAEGRAHPRNVD